MDISNRSEKQFILRGVKKKLGSEKPGEQLPKKMPCKTEMADGNCVLRIAPLWCFRTQQKCAC